MSTADVTKALRVPGRVAVGSSWTFTDPFPCGGTSLGEVGASVVRLREDQATVRVEDWGVSVEVADLVEKGSRLILVLALRGWDPTAVGAAFRNVVNGSSSGLPGVVHPGARQEGRLRSETRATGVLFVPDDAENHPAVYLPEALPWTAEELELTLSRRTELVLRVAFVSRRSSAEVGNAYQVRLLEDLVEPA